MAYSARCADRSARKAVLLANSVPVPTHSFKELTCRSFGLCLVRSGFFFDRHQFVAELVGLMLELCLEAFFALGVPLRPNRGIVLLLIFDHGIEDDRDFVSGCGGGSCWSELAFHPPKVVSQRGLIVMQ